MNFFNWAVAYYRDGGPSMHFVLITTIIVIAIVIERTIVIQRASSVNVKKLVEDLVRSVSTGDLNGARNLSRISDAPAARVASAMLDSGQHDEAALHAIADDTATLELPSLSHRLSHLGLLANVATMIGLVGTIFGLMTSFAGVGAADASQRSAFLAAGISEALHTTSFGLIVAVLTLLAQGWLASRVEAIHESVDLMAVKLGRALSRGQAQTRPQPAQVTPLPVSRPAAPQPQVVARTPMSSQGGGN